MFNVSNLDKKYQYDYFEQPSVLKVLINKYLDKKHPFQVVAFINDFVSAQKWEGDEITYYNCKRIEFFIQEKLPSDMTDKKEIYSWIVNTWKDHNFPALGTTTSCQKYRFLFANPYKYSPV
jgi:hypothetical protein